MTDDDSTSAFRFGLSGGNRGPAAGPGRGRPSPFLIALVALLVLAVRFARARNESTARALFLGSIAYLPLIWVVMILDH